MVSNFDFFVLNFNSKLTYIFDPSYHNIANHSNSYFDRYQAFGCKNFIGPVISESIG